jgi:hypothetical protein
MFHLPKSVIRKAKFNPNSCTAQNYKSIEYLAQETFVMPSLKILHNCSSQRRNLLLSIGTMDSEESNRITFNLDYFKQRPSHHLEFRIKIFVGGKNNHCTILDEGASTCAMYFPCWISLGSPKLTSSPTTLKSFYGCGFQPHGLLQYFDVTLKGKIVSVDIEVVDTPLDYNLLLVRSWFYAMTVVVSTVFCILRFPHQGQIIIVDQMDYIAPDIHNDTVNDIPFVGHSSL